MLKDNAVIHHFQHICVVLFAVMMISIYLSYTLLGMCNKGWIDVGAIVPIYFTCGFISVVVWFLWFFRTKENEPFDTIYRVLLLVSGIVAAILGRVYVGI